MCGVSGSIVGNGGAVVCGPAAGDHLRRVLLYIDVHMLFVWDNTRSDSLI